MTTYIALLRAVNVGGTGKLPMADLKALCAELGFGGVETYIASGNVIFDANVTAAAVQTRLEHKLFIYARKAIGVWVCTAAEMSAILERNPFPDKQPNLTYAFFLNEAASPEALANVRGRNGEEIRVGLRELYVYYPNGMGQSRLQIPAAKSATSRNLNTVAKLAKIGARK